MFQYHTLFAIRVALFLLSTMSPWDLDQHGISTIRWPSLCGVPQTNYCQPYGYYARLIVEIWTYRYSFESDWDLLHEHIYSSPIRYVFAVTPLIVAAHGHVMRVGCRS